MRLCDHATERPVTLLGSKLSPTPTWQSGCVFSRSGYSWRKRRRQKKESPRACKKRHRSVHLFLASASSFTSSFTPSRPFSPPHRSPPLSAQLARCLHLLVPILSSSTEMILSAIDLSTMKGALRLRCERFCNYDYRSVHLYPPPIVATRYGVIFHAGRRLTDSRCLHSQVERYPNPVVRITREAEWAQQHPSIMGPDNSYLYLGPESTAGYIIYGSNQTQIPMNFFLRPGKREGSL